MELDPADPNFAIFRPYSAVKLWLNPIFGPRDYAVALRNVFIVLWDLSNFECVDTLPRSRNLKSLHRRKKSPLGDL